MSVVYIILFAKICQVWKYTSTDSVVPDRHSWSFVAITQYTTACLTAAAHLSTNSTGWPLVTGATDGHLVFWSLSDRTRNLACEGLQSIHQSSIKAIATTEVTDNSWLVVSGGDDNALGFTILTTKDETSEYATSSLIVPSAHGAAVNAIGIFKRNRVAGQQASLGMHVVTASNDQVVRLWDVMIDPRKPGIKGVAVRKQGRYCSAVADISSVAIFARPRRDHQAGDIKILVSGVGTEVWAYGPIQ